MQIVDNIFTSLNIVTGPGYSYSPLNPVLGDGMDSSCCTVSGPYPMSPAQPNCCQLPNPPTCCVSPPTAHVHMNVGGQDYVISMNTEVGMLTRYKSLKLLLLKLLL